MTSTGGVIVAALAWSVLLFGPALVAAGRHWRTRWTAVAGAGPLVSLAVLGLLRGTSELADVAVHPAMVVGVLAGVALALRAGFHRRCPEARSTEPGSLGLICVVTASLAVWFVLSTSGRITLGGIDGPRHAFFVNRIMDGSGASASIVLRHDPEVDDPVSRYYPLSVHVGAATVQHLTGAGTADTVNGLGMVMGGIVLPCGWGLLARRWFAPRDRALVAGLAAFGSLWPWFGWSLGWLPYVSGMVVLPGALALVQLGLEHRRAWPLAVVASAGMVATHTGALCLFVVCAAALSMAGRPRWTRLRRTALVIGSGLVVMAPETWAMVTGVLERRTVASPTTRVTTGEVVEWITGGFAGSPVSIPLIVAALVGVVLARGPWRAIGVVIVAVDLLALALTRHDRGIVRLLGTPWNTDIERLVLTGYALAPLLAAPALSRAFDLARRHHRWGAPALAVAVMAVGARTTATALDGARFLTRTPSHWTQLVMEQASAAGPGRILAGYPYDGGLWLLSLDGPDPAFGWPAEFVATPESWAARQDLARLVADPASDPAAVAAAAQRACVGSVLVVDDAVTADPTYPFERSHLRAAPFLTELVAGHDASVFTIEGVDTTGCAPVA